ncbi:MAG: hypothetical protein A3H88_03155 [Candidatus Blackburnbacteria bacterium RIFCSPLOWO2_02_FULL_44_9]|nr:MAG: hypothetical protein A3H88_03155 [Candidatus Blackburnbacteria bacterium RIFCSPLOWO2_02_FULL_44_9]
MAKKRRVPKVFSNVIAPVQVWLLSQGRCVGCGRNLAQGKKSTQKDGSKRVTCECGRIFVSEDQKYRRALLEEV